jgi:hypothetical protein
MVVAGHCRMLYAPGIRNRVAFQWRAPRPGRPRWHSFSKVKMRGEDLMRADHFSEVVLLGAEVIFVSLLLLVIVALTRV